MSNQASNAEQQARAAFEADEANVVGMVSIERMLADDVTLKLAMYDRLVVALDDDTHFAVSVDAETHGLRIVAIQGGIATERHTENAFTVLLKEERPEAGKGSKRAKRPASPR